MSLKNIIYTVLFCVALCGCNESYSGLDYDYPNSDTITDIIAVDKVPVMMAVHDPYFISVSRGVGAIENNDEMKWRKDNASFYVYSFLSNNSQYSGEVNYMSHYVPEEANQGPMQCLIDGPDGYGAPARIHPESPLMLVFKDDAQFFYSQNYQDYKYKFFTYYCDDAQILGNRRVREKDRVYMDIKIDGTQDIISGSAHKLTDKQMDELDNKYSGEEDKWFFNKMLNGDLVHSTMSGHRMFFPIFEINHELSYFVFNVRGDNMMTDVTYIKDIYVKAHTDWRFTVAADNVDEVGLSLAPGVSEKLEDLHLCDVPAEGESVDGTKNWLQDANVFVTNADEDFVRLGNGMLLPPRESYELYIVCESRSQDGKVRSYKAKYNLKLSDGESFKAGTQYTVNMHVYGFQAIEMRLEGKWVKADPIILDEDDIVGFE